ncbi:MAG: hypothetical protein ACOCYG_02235 [Spirochaetota bacterium]
MRKAILLGFVFLLAVTTGAAAQVMAGASPGAPGFDWAEVNVEFGLGNWVSIGVSPGVRMAGGFGDAVRAGVDARFYPLHGRDLGLRGFPYDVRDLGHQFSPYIAVGGGVGLVFPEEGQSFAVSSLAFQANVEVGARWYPFRTFVVSTAHLFDNIFLEVPFGYEVNISDLTGVLGYDQNNTEILGRSLFGVPNLYAGIWAGIIL